jgi:hypothetical protein
LTPSLRHPEPLKKEWALNIPLTRVSESVPEFSSVLTLSYSLDIPMHEYRRITRKATVRIQCGSNQNPALGILGTRPTSLNAKPTATAVSFPNAMIPVPTDVWLKNKKKQV